MKKILIIDDEADLREALVEFFKSEQFEVFEAEDGKSGYETARKNVPDIIVSDIRMANVDGYEVLKKLREDPLTATIPIILMTGYAEQEGMRRGMILGADDFISKPFKSLELLESVQVQLKKHEIFREVSEKKMSDLRTNIALALPHELRTPLNAVIGFSDIMKKSITDLSSSEIVQMATAINKAGNRLLKMIENFLVYAQIEVLATDHEQVISLRNEANAESNQVIKAAAISTAQSHDRQPDLKMNITEMAVNISSEHLGKIVAELVDNALKFSKPGSPVTIDTYTEKGMYYIIVSDEGKGMSKEQVMNIGGYIQFDRKVYEQQGSGLGLSIARRLTELFGGSIKIESAVDKGTSIIIGLPVAD